MKNKKELTVNSKDLSFQQNTRLVHQVIFIDGFSGIDKTTLAKKLFEFLKKCDNEGVYIEQNRLQNIQFFALKRNAFCANLR